MTTRDDFDPTTDSSGWEWLGLVWVVPMVLFVGAWVAGLIAVLLGA